jgi:mannose-6-phosphate isomerase
MLYPLKFKPIYKSPIWGGQNISKLPERKNVPDLCGESWEISAVEDNVSVVSNGFLKGNSLTELIEIYMSDLLGEDVYNTFGLVFPLLVKIIDTNDYLSVQVHPNDEYAYEKHKSFGKTEMWYVINAEKDASIINGFLSETSSEMVSEAAEKGSLGNLLRSISAETGDVHFIPSGRVHAIGKGVMLAEIQQNSDITYRLFDWNRLDNNGKSRQLHINEAVEVLDYSNNFTFTQAKSEINKAVQIAQCDYFTTNLIEVNGFAEREYISIDTFKILLCTNGNCKIKTENCEDTILNTGETVLIPACIEHIIIESTNNCTLLETYMENINNAD